MLLLALACTLPFASSGADSGLPGVGDDTDIWDICWRTMSGDASGTYYRNGEFQGGCGGEMTIGCDEETPPRGAAVLSCDGPLSWLTLEIAGVQSGKELGGAMSITSEGSTEPTAADWYADVQRDFSVVGGFETTTERIDGLYELSGAFAVGVPAAM